MWSISYGKSAHNPFWGAQTSAVNFCEEDYIVTRYVAEFINTITSLSFIAYGIHGIYRFKRHNVGVFASENWAYWGLISLGFASGGYHTSLKYHTQMADELSMHLAIGLVLYQVFSFDKPPAQKRRVLSIILGVLVPFFIYHSVADEFVLHVVLFFIMSVTVSYKTQSVIKERVKNPIDRKKMGRLAKFATTSALVSYFIWNMENIFCSHITAAKRKLGLPWAFLLELHGWWHIGTAVASYTFMALIEFLTSPEGADSNSIGFAWPARNVLKDIVPLGSKVTAKDGTATKNGTVNGVRDKKD